MADPDDPDAPVDRPRKNETRTNLIVNYLPQFFRDEELYSLFVAVGPVESATVAKDRATNYSYGYGFVRYGNPEDAAVALRNLNGLAVQNKKIRVSYARPRNKVSIKDTNLYVSNLGQAITEERLDEIFSPFGRILSKKVLIDQRTKIPRGTAFVRFSKTEEAAAAMQDLSGTYIDGSASPLVIKVAEEHGKQKASFYAGVMNQHQNYSRLPPTSHFPASPGQVELGQPNHRNSGGGFRGAGNYSANHRFSPMGRGGGRGRSGSRGFYRGNGDPGYNNFDHHHTRQPPMGHFQQDFSRDYRAGFGRWNQ